MSAYPSPTTGPGPGQQTLLPAPKPIIPVVPVVPGQIQPSREDYNDASRSVVERTATISGVETLLPIIYGTDQTGAKITAVVASGANLLLRCEWCSAYGYGIDAVQSYFVDGVAPSGGITATHYTGTQTTPDATLVAAYAAQGKSYTDTLAGIAYSVVSVPAGVTQGFPRIVAQIRGQKVRTTLAGSYAFNENPVWLIAWLLVDRLGVAIDWTAFATAAAVCDATVGSPPEKKYTIGLSLETEQDVWNWVDLVLGYCRGFRWFDNGLHGITIGNAAQTTSGYVTESLMSNGDIEIKSRNVKNQPTVVRIYYTNLQNGLAADDFAEAQLPGVGTTLPYWLSEIRKPGINRFSQANREAIEVLNDLYLGDTFVNFGTRDQGLKYLPGDVVELTHSRGLSGKKVHVLSNAPTDAGRWRMETREYDPAMYSSVVVTTPTYPDTSLPTPSSPPTVGSLTLTEEYVVQPVGAMPLSRIRITWAAITNWPFLAGYRVILRDSNNSVVDDQVITGAVYVSPPLPALTTYTCSVYARSQIAQSATASPGTISLVGTGVESLATVASAAISTSGSWFIDGPEQYSLYPGDANMRIRMDFGVAMDNYYSGADMSSPGRATMLLDSWRSPAYSTSIYSFTVISPEYDLGSERSGVVALLNVQDWAAIYGSAMQVTIQARNAANTITSSTIGYRAQVTSARYVKFRIDTTREKAGPTTWYSYQWAIEFVNSTMAMLMPTVTDRLQGTTSASGVVNIALPRRYISITDVQVTAVGSTEINPVPGTPVTSEIDLASNYLPLRAFNAGSLVAANCNIQITGVAA